MQGQLSLRLVKMEKLEKNHRFSPIQQLIVLFLLLQVTDVKSQPNQFFRVKPSNADVAEGGTAIIACEVANRRGRVQWTKDGLTLGYDRKLPGFPRYRVLGSDESGEYSLKVSNATLDDDAVYECQVGPASNNKPIRASARLNVMLPPTKIEIAGLQPDSSMTIRENEAVELRCVVHNAKPKATIVWFRENTEFITDTRQDEDEQSGSRGDRITTTSLIKFRPTSADNDITWACEAEHPALLNPPMRTAVLLSVQHPPGPPEISGYIEGETIRLGQTITLVCTAEGGNPLAEIIWYKNGIKVDYSYTTSGRASSNTYSFVASTEDNNARYRCESKNELSPTPLSAEIILSVQFAPTNVRLTGPSEARVGDSLNFECITENSNPPATIQWFVDNRTLSTETQTTNTVTSLSGGWVTRSNISVAVNPNDRNKIISCNAINSELNDIKTQSHVLTIIYPPGLPEIQGLEEDEILIAANLKRLTCTSIAGNPLATLKWFSGQRELPSVYTTRDNYASAELAFVPEQADNRAELRCEATNVAIEDSDSSPFVASRQLNVQFAPAYVQVSILPESPKSGQNATVICETGSSRPSATIDWWSNGQKLTKDATEMVVDGGDNGGYVTSSHLHITLSSEHHGAVITCEATNKIVKKRVHKDITLSVRHKPMFDEDIPRTIEMIEGHRGMVNLTANANPERVIYQWIKDTKNGPRQIRNFGLNNENVVNADNTAFNKLHERIFTADGVLNITKVMRNDAGFYTIKAKNDEGASQTKIKLDVLYEPRITDITTTVLVGEGEPAHLECRVDANPLTDDTISWRRLEAGYDMKSKTKTTRGLPGPGQSLRSIQLSSKSDTKKVNTQLSNLGPNTSPEGSNVGVLLLTVLNSTAEDSGPFWCVADNGIGNIEVKNATYLLVRHKPQMRKTPLTSKSASDLGEVARLVCEAKGVPNVTFSWSRAGGGGGHILMSDYSSTSTSTSNGKFKISSVALDPLTYRSEFFIYNVTHKDYGSYECVARNSEGVGRSRVVLDVKSRPDPPSHLHVVNVTNRAVHLAWVPGFHGGMDQYFRIRFSRTDGAVMQGGGITKYDDVYPANADEAILTGLQPGVEYGLSIMAFNNIGESNYTSTPAVIVRTSSQPSLDSRESMMRSLEDQGEIPLIVIVSVSVCGTILLLLNIVLISCFVHKKRQQKVLRDKEHSGSDVSGSNVQKPTPPSEGSSSNSGSTKSGTMELYTTSSYNETMSGGGETLSSISEKSCISQPGNPSPQGHQQISNHGVNTHNGGLPLQLIHNQQSDFISPLSYVEEDNFPYSRSTYLIDPPSSSNENSNFPGPSVVTFVNQKMKYMEDEYNMNMGMNNGNTISPDPMGLNGYCPLEAITDEVDNPMSLYSVVHKGPGRKTGGMVSAQPQVAPVHRQSFNQQNGGSSLGNIMEDYLSNSQVSCCSHQLPQNFEDTDSEYASKLRRQTHKHLMGDHGGYVTRPLVSTIIPPPPSSNATTADGLPQQSQILSGGGHSMNNGCIGTMYSTLPHPHGQRNGFTPSSTMPHSSTYQQLRLPHPTELDLDLAGMQQTTHFNHPSSVANNVTSPISIHTTNSMSATPTIGVMGGPAQTNQNQVEGPICSSSPKRTMSAFTTFGPHGQRSNASTPVSPPAVMLPTSTNGLHPINGSISVSSNSATPSPQVMSSPLQQQQQYLLKKSSAGNGPVPTTGHLV